MKNNIKKIEKKLKISLVGYTGCGKTCIAHRYCENEYKDNFILTIGVDYKKKTIETDEFKLILQLYDLGYESAFEIYLNYAQNSDGIIFVVDYIDYDNYATMYIKDFYNAYKNRPNKEFSSLICINKCDLGKNENTQKRKKEIENFASENNIKIFEVSAKTGKNINEAFNELIYQILKKDKSKQKERHASPKEIVPSISKHYYKSFCLSKLEKLNEYINF